MSIITCAELPSHFEVECNDFPKGGIPAIAVLERDHTITDFTSQAQWNANILSGKARVLKRIKGNMPAASAFKVDNPVGCGADQILDGWDRTFEWTDASVNSGNDDFYNTLNIKESYLVMFLCEENQIRVVTHNVTFEANLTIPPSNKEIQTYKAIASWSTPANEAPVLYTAPAGIFE